MRAASHACFDRKIERMCHAFRIACMSAAGNIAAGNIVHDFCVGAFTFAKVGIEVDMSLHVTPKHLGGWKSKISASKLSQWSLPSAI